MIVDLITQSEFHNNQLSIVIQILSLYNCRSSEVLNAKWINFYPGKYLILEGAKKSCNVIIRDRIILTLIAELPRFHKTKIFNQITYNKLYHHIKAYYSHLFVKFRTKKYYKVTHGFRYSSVETIDNDEKIRDILHHRSVKSGKYYKSKK